MNIFFLDTNPNLAAQYQCNKHVVKMVLEATQLLCGAHWKFKSYGIPKYFMRLVYENHPMSQWVRHDSANYGWLSCHALALSNEYTYRYNKTHSVHDIIKWCADNHPDLPYRINNRIKFGGWVLTKPPLCMPNKFKSCDVVSSYRSYYKWKRTQMKMVWTNRNIPLWIGDCNEG